MVYLFYVLYIYVLYIYLHESMYGIFTYIIYLHEWLVFMVFRRRFHKKIKRAISVDFLGGKRFLPIPIRFAGTMALRDFRHVSTSIQYLPPAFA